LAYLVLFSLLIIGEWLYVKRRNGLFRLGITGPLVRCLLFDLPCSTLTPRLLTSSSVPIRARRNGNPLLASTNTQLYPSLESWPVIYTCQALSPAGFSLLLMSSFCTTFYTIALPIDRVGLFLQPSGDYNRIQKYPLGLEHQGASCIVNSLVCDIFRIAALLDMMLLSPRCTYFIRVSWLNSPEALAYTSKDNPGAHPYHAICVSLTPLVLS